MQFSQPDDDFLGEPFGWKASTDSMVLISYQPIIHQSYT